MAFVLKHQKHHLEEIWWKVWWWFFWCKVLQLKCSSVFLMKIILLTIGLWNWSLQVFINSRYSFWVGGGYSLTGSKTFLRKSMRQDGRLNLRLPKFGELFSFSWCPMRLKILFAPSFATLISKPTLPWLQRLSDEWVLKALEYMNSYLPAASHLLIVNPSHPVTVRCGQLLDSLFQGADLCFILYQNWSL